MARVIRPTNYARDLFPKTLTVHHLAWPVWVHSEKFERDIPDMHPMSVTAFFLDPKEAYNAAYEMTFEKRLSDEDYDGPCSLSDTFFQMRDWIDEDARKELNKVHQLVYKKFITFVFENPVNRDHFFVLYTNPYDERKVLDLYHGQELIGYSPVDIKKEVQKEKGVMVGADTFRKEEEDTGDRTNFCTVEEWPADTVSYYCQAWHNNAQRNCAYASIKPGTRICAHQNERPASGPGSAMVPHNVQVWCGCETACTDAWEVMEKAVTGEGIES